MFPCVDDIPFFIRQHHASKFLPKRRCKCVNMFKWMRIRVLATNSCRKWVYRCEFAKKWATGQHTSVKLGKENEQEKLKKDGVHDTTNKSRQTGLVPAKPLIAGVLSRFPPQETGTDWRNCDAQRKFRVPRGGITLTPHLQRRRCGSWVLLGMSACWDNGVGWRTSKG